MLFSELYKIVVNKVTSIGFSGEIPPGFSPVAQPDFCSCELSCHSIECVLLHYFNAQPYIFAVVNCPDVALSVFYSPFSRVAGYLCSHELLCLSVECCVLVRSPTWSSDNLCSLSETLYNNGKGERV